MAGVIRASIASSTTDGAALAELEAWAATAKGQAIVATYLKIHEDKVPHLVDEIRDEDDVVVLHRGRVLAHDRAARLHAGRPLADVFIEMTGGAEVAA